MSSFARILRKLDLHLQLCLVLFVAILVVNGLTVALAVQYSNELGDASAQTLSYSVQAAILTVSSIPSSVYVLVAIWRRRIRTHHLLVPFAFGGFYFLGFTLHAFLVEVRRCNILLTSVHCVSQGLVYVRAIFLVGLGVAFVTACVLTCIFGDDEETRGRRRTRDEDGYGVQLGDVNGMTGAAGNRGVLGIV